MPKKLKLMEKHDTERSLIAWRFSRWAPAFGFHLVKVGTVSWYIRAWPRAHPSCACQAGQLCNGRMLSLSAVQPTMVGFPGGHWGLCNSDVKGGMGGYSPLPSVSIFGCGCWDQQRTYSEINGEHLLVTIQQGSMGTDGRTGFVLLIIWTVYTQTHKPITVFTVEFTIKTSFTCHFCNIWIFLKSG